MNKVLFTIITYLGYFNFYASWEDEKEIEYEINSLNYGKSNKGKIKGKEVKEFINLIDEIDLPNDDCIDIDEEKMCTDCVEYNVMIVRNGISHLSIWHKENEPENIDNLFKAIKLCDEKIRFI